MKRTTLNFGTFTRFETCTLLIAFAWTIWSDLMQSSTDEEESTDE